MVLNLVVLCRIFSIALLPSKQGHFAIVIIAIMRLSRTSITLFFDTIVSF